MTESGTPAAAVKKKSDSYLPGSFFRISLFISFSKTPSITLPRQPELAFSGCRTRQIRVRSRKILKKEKYAMSRLYFFILVLLVSISGFSQGMLLPVISVIFETNGESAAINGLHATGLYIGVLLASPFMEAPLRKLGFKPLMVMGGFLVIISLFSFIWLQSIWLWFFFGCLSESGIICCIFQPKRG